MADDVRALPLTDDDDFFSDLGSDEPYFGEANVGSGGRLTIETVNANTTQRPGSGRHNPFGTASEVRARNFNCSPQGQSDSKKPHIHLDTTSAADNHNHNGQIDCPEGHSGGHLPHCASEISSSRDHCHVPHKHEADNVVRNQLIIISICTTLFGTCEAIGAVYSGSIAIGTDVMHLASDLLSFIISLIAVYLAKKAPTARFAWGFHRAEVLGALLSVFVIWVVTGVLVYLAANRIIYQQYDGIKPSIMLYTSIAGVVFNIIMALVLNVNVFKCKVSHGHSHDGGGHGHSHDGGGVHAHSHGGGGQGHSHGGHSHLPMSTRARDGTDRENLTTGNGDDPDAEEHSAADWSPPPRSGSKDKNIVIRAAFVHVIGDLIQSVGVMVSAIVIKFEGEAPNSMYRMADPICTFLFSVLVLITTITVIRDAFFMLMEGSPKKVPYDYNYDQLAELPGVKSVHSLKFWSLTSNEVNASVHLAVDESIPYPFELVKKANAILREGGVVTRSTVQIDVYDELTMQTCLECLHPGPSNVYHNYPI